jgi:hypothetical protein
MNGLFTRIVIMIFLSNITNNDIDIYQKWVLWI